MDAAQVNPDGSGAVAIVFSEPPEQSEPEPEPESSSSSSEPEPEPASEPEPLDPMVAEYIRDGISHAGLLHVIAMLGAALPEDATTSDLCQVHIKPRTVAPGWLHEPELIRLDEQGNDISANRWYKHAYVRRATGERQTASPPGTRSLCRMLAEDPNTAHMVDRPTHFLSHAWVYRIRNVADAMGKFVGSQPGGREGDDGGGEPSPTAYFWFDCCSLDQHAQAGN